MIEIIGPILAALLGSSLFKKHPYCIWIMGADGKWSSPNPAGNSARRCGKAAKQYIDKGVPLGSIMILPKGILPPNIGG